MTDITDTESKGEPQLHTEFAPTTALMMSSQEAALVIAMIDNYRHRRVQSAIKFGGACECPHCLSTYLVAHRLRQRIMQCVPAPEFSAKRAPAPRQDTEDDEDD